MEVLIEHGRQVAGSGNYCRGDMSSYKIFTVDGDVYTEIDEQAKAFLLRFSETTTVKIPNTTNWSYIKTRKIWNFDDRGTYLLKVTCIEVSKGFIPLLKHEIHVLISKDFDPLIIERENLFLFKGYGTIVGKLDVWFTSKRIKNKDINNDGLIF